MKECLKLVMTVALLAVVGADLGLNVAFIFGSPNIYQHAYYQTKQSDNLQADPNGQPLSSLPLIASIAQASQRAAPPNSENPYPSYHSDIWTIFQGLSAPIIACFTLVLMCVGYGQLRAIQRQADISEKILVPAERAYMFVKDINAKSHRSPETDRRKFMYIWGWAKYYDVFDRKAEHVTRFCWQLRIAGDPTEHHHPETNRTEVLWVHHERHNCADEECP